MQHAKASPSDYRRWTTCPGAITLQSRLGDLLPPDDSSEAAALGTELHSRAERALKGECEPCELTQFYVDYCRKAAEDDEAEMLIEARVPLFYSRDEHGYADCVVRTEDTVEIIDLKTGSIPVEAVKNYQLFIYAYGMGLTTTEKFKMTIVQNDVAKSWEVDAYQAEAIASVIGVQAQAAMNDYITELNASDDACRWCRCKAYCKAYTASTLNSLTDLSTDMTRLSDEAMAYLFANAKQIRATLAEIEKQLFHRVSEGEQINGVHIKDGRRGAKTWRADVDPVEIMEAAGIAKERALVTRPISPTQAMRLGDIDESAWYQPEGKPVLAAGDVVDVTEFFKEI